MITRLAKNLPKPRGGAPSPLIVAADPWFVVISGPISPQIHQFPTAFGNPLLPTRATTPGASSRFPFSPGQPLKFALISLAGDLLPCFLR